MKQRLVNLRRHLRSVRYRWQVMLHDLLMIPLAWLSAYWLRYNLSDIPQEFLHQAFVVLPWVICAQGVVLVLFGTHRGVWRFTSLPDLVRILKSVVVGTTLVALVIFLITRLEYVPRSVFILYAILLAGVLCGSRLVFRMIKDQQLSTAVEKRALVVGAGAAGEQLVRDLRRNTTRICEPVAFVDDDPAKGGKEIHGIRVVGSCDVIGDLSDRWNIDLILIAVPSATDKQMQRIVGLCERTGIEFRTLPAINDIVTGHVSLSDMRQVRIDDLLGRDPVQLDWRQIKYGLKDKVVLVTGAGGSIGSELCRQLVNVSPKNLVLFENSEFNLYQIEQELTRNSPQLNCVAILGDVCDQAAVNNVFQRYAPDVVFHAAAFKHVPLLEGQLREAVKNNVIGSCVVARQATECDCETFVLISTDKAVNPSSLMGTCKRVAEIYCQALDTQCNTRYVTVRFGNVLGSAGSVVPLFQRQIREGGPVTVTHPDVTRYFMTITEATQLILEASTVGNGGGIYVLDMGEPIKVRYLAEQMIKLSGKIPGDDVAVVYTGLRPGEKLYEELFHSEEPLSDTDHDKILLASSRKVEWKVVAPIITRMEHAVKAFDEEGLEDLLTHLVPEFSRGERNQHTPDAQKLIAGDTIGG